MSSSGKKPQGDMKQSKRGHIPFPEWLTEKLDIPPDLLEGGMRVEIRGREAMLIHGCKKILVYTPQSMRLKMKDCCICITGDRLICHTYLAGAVGIEGKIISLCYEE